MQPLATLEYEFTDDLVDQAAASYARAMSAVKPVEYPKQFLTVVGLLLLAAVGSAWVIREGVPLWTLIVPALLAAPVVLMVVLWALVYLLGGLFGPICVLLFHLTRWRMRRAVRAQDDRRIRWTLTEAGFEVHSAVQYRNVPWSDLTHLWTGPDFWFVGLRCVTPRLLLPAAVLRENVRELLRRKAVEAGAKVVETEQSEQPAMPDALR
jgi:hypothetical protein